jgi:hypothetical protein
VRVRGRRRCGYRRSCYSRANQKLNLREGESQPPPPTAPPAPLPPPAPPRRCRCRRRHHHHHHHHHRRRRRRRRRRLFVCLFVCLFICLLSSKRSWVIPLEDLPEELRHLHLIRQHSREQRGHLHKVSSPGALQLGKRPQYVLQVHLLLPTTWARRVRPLDPFPGFPKF